MKKPITLRCYGRVDPMGYQVVTYVIMSRKRQRVFTIGTMLGCGDEPQWNKRLLKDPFRRLRAGWRDEVLGKGWQERKAKARFARMTALHRPVGGDQ